MASSPASVRECRRRSALAGAVVDLPGGAGREAVGRAAGDGRAGALDRAEDRPAPCPATGRSRRPPPPPNRKPPAAGCGGRRRGPGSGPAGPSRSRPRNWPPRSRLHLLRTHRHRSRRPRPWTKRTSPLLDHRRERRHRGRRVGAEESAEGHHRHAVIGDDVRRVHARWRPRGPTSRWCAAPCSHAASGAGVAGRLRSRTSARPRRCAGAGLGQGGVDRGDVRSG